MEKFGIFELLDTLSALAAPPAAAESNQKVPAEKDRPGEGAFAPPPYATPEPTEKREEKSALFSLLERQEKISRRIDKNK